MPTRLSPIGQVRRTGHSPVFPPLNRNTAADASSLTMSFLSPNAGVTRFSKAGLSLLAIANTAAARTGHFLSEQALAKAASIFGSRSLASSFAAAARTGVRSSVTSAAERYEAKAGFEPDQSHTLWTL